MVNIDIPLAGNIDIQIIKRGTQIVKYDSLNGQVNPNPYQLPFIFTRTPYDKKNNTLAGGIMALLGYTYAMQDMRGRYASEGVYFPMYSDGWAKSEYHPDFTHIGDITQLNDPVNSLNHEDGYNSIQFILDSLIRDYGNLPHTDTMLHNGVIGMFGASALGNTQYQAAAAHRIDPSGPGLKGLLPIVATNEHYNVTGFQNGVFRESIVVGWLKGQILDLEDHLLVNDSAIQNEVHTALDYNMNTVMDVAEEAIEYFTSFRSNGSNPGAYPNCIARSDMDASRAYVDSSGEADANGDFSRYSNMRVPAYHLTGWWDIFIDGQIETFNKMRSNIGDSLARLQKLVIGPWAHQTISSLSTGDMYYKDNVGEITKFDLEHIETVSLSSILESELIQWYRYTLNNNSYKKIGDPTYIFPENKEWDDIGGYFTVRIPAEDYEMSFTDMVNFLNGSKSLKNMKGEVRFDPPGTILDDSLSFSFDVPAFGTPLIEGMESSPVDPIPLPDFANDVSNVRFYVIGPVNDGVAENAELSNYWFHSDTFPIVDDIHWEDCYLHKNGDINDKMPGNDEGFIAYVHDPDDPIMTVGGANMITAVPNGNKKSQGQINLADSNYSKYTMDRPGVIQFETGLIEDSLCIIGMPRMTLYAKSNPAGNIDGLTDTDFFIRVLDVYPDGREYFVVEGAVNARAREYARSLANDAEDDNAVYSNINSGQVYEYYFKLLPIAYTWGKNHKLKILISSSNHTRYQVNANIPVDDGEFYIRTPMDGRSFAYQGQTVLPRKTVQRIAFSPDYPTNLSIPVFQPGWSAIDIVKTERYKNEFLLFPNPSDKYVTIITGSLQKSIVKMYDLVGKEIYSAVFRDEHRIDHQEYLNGIYIVNVTTEGMSQSKKLIIR